MANNNIKWRESDEQRFNKLVKNAQAKVRRLRVKEAQRRATEGANYKPLVIPEFNKKDIRDLIKTRKDFNREMKMLERWTKRGSEEMVKIPDIADDVYITKFTKKEQSIRAGIINRRRAKIRKELENLPSKLGGYDQTYKVGDIGMGSASEHAYNHYEAFTPGTKYSDVNRRVNSARKQTSDKFYSDRMEALKKAFISTFDKNNDVRSFEDEISSYGITYKELKNRLLEKMENMDPWEFYKTFESAGGTFEASYPSQEIISENLEFTYASWFSNGV